MRDTVTVALHDTAVEDRKIMFEHTAELGCIVVLVRTGAFVRKSALGY